MESTDLELIDELRGLVGGTQLQLAERIGVKPSAISNWLAAKRVPHGSKERLLKLREELRNPEQSSKETRADTHIPDRLRSDAECCGFWGKSAWAFHYLREPEDPMNTAVDDDVWRTWNSVEVTQHSTFRHNSRYRPFADSADLDPPECRGLGFLSGWRPDRWTEAHLSGGTQLHMAASADLEPTKSISGGYYLRARNSGMRWSTDEDSYEFVTFKAECPVESTHLVLSVPRSLIGHGLKVGYRVAMEYSQFYDIAKAIQSDTGELDRTIEPWGRVLPVQRMKPETIDAWAKDWGSGSSDEIQKIASLFAPSQDRDVYIVSDASPIPLATLLLFWPLPRKE